MNILLVEDMILAQTVIRRNLENMGHRVHLAENGGEASELIKNHQYDLIMLDMELPGKMSGLDIIKIIRTCEKVHTPVVSISSLGHAIRDKCLAAGYDDVYDKPMKFEDVSKIITSVEKKWNKKNILQSKLQ